MAVDVTNAYVATPPIDGGVYSNAPLGTALPTDVATALNVAFKDNGALGPDGITINPKRTTDKKKMFGGGTFVTVQSDYEETVKLTLMEDDNVNVLATVFGSANVVVTPATSSAGTKKKVYHTEAALPILSHVMDTVYGDKKKRYVIERGQVTEVAEIKSVHDDVTMYEITIDCYRGSTSGTNYATVVEYRDDGKKTTV